MRKTCVIFLLFFLLFTPRANSRRGFHFSELYLLWFHFPKLLYPHGTHLESNKLKKQKRKLKLVQHSSNKVIKNLLTQYSYCEIITAYWVKLSSRQKHLRHENHLISLRNRKNQIKSNFQQLYRLSINISGREPTIAN